MRAWNVLVLAGFFWLAACGAGNPTAPTPATATPETVPLPLATTNVPVATRAPIATLVPIPEANPPSSPIALNLWVPEDFAPGAERGGDVLEAQLAEFQSIHPGITVNYVLKAPYGKGGLVDWLRQLTELMPDRLPDAVIVDSRELDQLEQLQLLQPMSRELPSGAFWDLFPPAQRIARRGGGWVNQPLVLETEHLVYDTRRVGIPPSTWDQVLKDPSLFAFAADSTDTFLLHYLHDGGSLGGQLSARDAEIMQDILTYYRRARANGNMNATTAVMKSARDVMPLFVAGQAPLGQVRARDYLVERARIPAPRAAPVPTRDGTPAALVSSWSYVILTSDPARQRAAAEYLKWISDPTRMAEWASAARLVPAGQGAFAQAIVPEDYADMLRGLLTEGIVAPSFAEQAPFAEAWHTAIQAVLNGVLSPDDAAFRAIQTITQ